jgi:hypothetical protein
LDGRVLREAGKLIGEDVCELAEDFGGVGDDDVLGKPHGEALEDGVSDGGVGAAELKEVRRREEGGGSRGSGMVYKSSVEPLNLEHKEANSEKNVRTSK